MSTESDANVREYIVSGEGAECDPEAPTCPSPTSCVTVRNSDTNGVYNHYCLRSCGNDIDCPWVSGTDRWTCETRGLSRYFEGTAARCWESSYLD